MEKNEIKLAKEIITDLLEESGFFRADLPGLIKDLRGESFSLRVFEKAIEELHRERKIESIISKGREFLEWRKEKKQL